jgi:hypothetical protein
MMKASIRSHPSKCVFVTSAIKPPAQFVLPLRVKLAQINKTTVSISVVVLAHLLRALLMEYKYNPGAETKCKC